MIWDKLFWSWFAASAAFFLLILSDEASTVNMFFGSVLAGLGLVKMAGEGSPPQPRVSRGILERLKK